MVVSLEKNKTEMLMQDSTDSARELGLENNASQNDLIENVIKHV